MIRKVLFAITVLCGLWACKDDKVVFDAPVPGDAIAFEPASGGAIMRYTLPQNTDICGICAHYVDEQGEEVTIVGTAFADSVLLTGFHAPQEHVPVSITVLDNNNVESASIERTFSTLASAPYAFMDSIQVISTWGGVRIEASYTGTASGIVDVYRVGTNPFTKEIDTLYVTNFSITAGDMSNFLSIESEGDETTVVLRSEDGNGNFVRSVIFSGLTQFAIEQYPQEKLAISDPGGYSYEYEGEPDMAHGWFTAVGIQYLIDGDTKGTRCAEKRGEYGSDYYYTYVTNANACGSYVQLALEEPRVIGTVRVYASLCPYDAGDHFDSNYDDRLPNHVRILASNDPDLPMEEWAEIGEFYQNREGTSGNWTDDIPYFGFEGPTLEQVNEAEPVYAEAVCEVSETEYQYLRVVAVDHFSTWHMVGDNIADYVSYHELEVYVKAEE